MAYASLEMVSIVEKYYPVIILHLKGTDGLTISRRTSVQTKIVIAKIL